MQSPPSHPVINPAALAEIRHMAGDELTLVAEIIDCYFQEAPTLIAAMQKAVLQQDSEQLTRTAHSLKSSSQSLGAVGLAKLCLELEQLGRSSKIEDRTEDVSTAMAQLQAEYVRVVAALREERDRVL